MKKKKIVSILITIVVLIVGVLLIAWVLTSNKKKNAQKTAVVAQEGSSVVVRVYTVKKELLEQDVTANGNFVAARQMDFSSENAGRVALVLVKEGSYVTKGQTLAIIKADQLNVDVESAAAAYLNALKEKERYERASATGGVTQQQVDQATLTLSDAAAKLQQAKIKVNDTYIRSSINGIVNKRFIEPGAVVSPGTKLFELVDVSRLKLQVTVNEGQVARLKQGDKVDIHVSVFPDKKFTGRISFIAPKADEALNFPLEIELDQNPGGLVKAGMYGTALFSLPLQAPVVMIPHSAFPGSVSSNQVFVVQPDTTAMLRKVVAGRIAGDKVEVLQGLTEGETVIISGQINLNDGSKVSIVK